MDNKTIKANDRVCFIDDEHAAYFNTFAVEIFRVIAVDTVEVWGESLPIAILIQEGIDLETGKVVMFNPKRATTEFLRVVA